MDLSDIEVPRVFVTCRNMDDWTENFDNFNIQFGREEFCLVSGLKFDVENLSDYNKAKEPISFRRRVFSSDLDGGHITGNDVELLIESDVFKKLDDNDAVSLCCVGIVQLVLLGVEDRRVVPKWILRLANDRVGWEDKLSWGSLCMACKLLQEIIGDANVKCWQPLYASSSTNESNTKTYSIEGFAWAFKGQLPVERLVPDETEARSRWFMEDTRRVPEANTTPIIPDQQFGASGISGFQSYRGLPSAFHTLANNSSFLNMATPSNWQTPNQSNWLSPSNSQTPNPSYLGTPNSQPPIPSPHGTSNLQNPMTSYYSPNLPPPSQDAGILDPNLCDRARREPQPSIYMLSPYTVLPPTTELPKKRIDKTKKKGNTKKLSPMNLGNTFADENVSGDDVTITGVQQTDNYFNYENVDPDKGFPSSFHTLPNNSSFFNMATPSNCQTPNQSNWLSPSNWQTPNPSYLGTPNSQPLIPSQPGTSNWQNPMTSYSPNLPPPIPSHRQDARILDPNLCDRARREPQPSVYMLSPYTVLPPTTVLTKKRIDKTKKKGKTEKLSPLNLGNTFADENVSGDDVTITGVQQTDNYFNYETVDPDKVTRDAYVTMTEFLLDPYDIYLDCYMKGYKLPSFFWPQLVPHLCTYRRERSWPEGWLSSDFLIKERTENANWTLAKSGTICLHQENNRFMILTDPHNIGTLDGSVRPFPSWNDVTWVYMPINAGGVHWVTGAINLADSIFYVFDSMESETRMLMLEQQVRDWTPVINRILETRGYFNGTGRQPHNF
ncbi:phospholipase-like protein [Tanacetum coccineum]